LNTIQYNTIEQNGKEPNRTEQTAWLVWLHSNDSVVRDKQKLQNKDLRMCFNVDAQVYFARTSSSVLTVSVWISPITKATTINLLEG
jgi:hypothetical protein